MNFGDGHFARLILVRDDGSSYAVELNGIEGHSIRIGRSGNRTKLFIELQADMGVVRYQPSDALRLASGKPQLEGAKDLGIESGVTFKQLPPGEEI